MPLMLRRMRHREEEEKKRKIPRRPDKHQAFSITTTTGTIVAMNHELTNQKDNELYLDALPLTACSPMLSMHSRFVSICGESAFHSPGTSILSGSSSSSKSEPESSSSKSSSTSKSTERFVDVCK
uniref:Uncharacterized protein n=1 Tax=Glossina pallidipes TaxID=7398 RepID=A0A1B0AA01_GLOPL